MLDSCAGIEAKVLGIGILNPVVEDGEPKLVGRRSQKAPALTPYVAERSYRRLALVLRLQGAPPPMLPIKFAYSTALASELYVREFLTEPTLVARA